MEEPSQMMVHQENHSLRRKKERKTHNSVREIPLADFVIDEIVLQRQRYNTLKADLGEDFHDLGYIVCQDNGLPRHRSFKKCRI